MALLWPCPSSSSPLLQPREHTVIPTPFISKTQIPATSTLKNFSVSLSVSRSNCYPSLQRTCSVTSSSSSTESESSPPTGVFIKGLPESMTEGHMKKAFSLFGEVVKVKIVIEKMSKKPLGSAFVWFARKDSAEAAVEEMNGKFFGGRFIFVKIAEPWLSKDRGRRKRYKF